MKILFLLFSLSWTVGSVDVETMNHLGLFSFALLNKETELGLSAVKLLPNQRQVSAFINQGASKRFLFLTDEAGVGMSITVTPCTAILSWHIKFFSLDGGNETENGEILKNFRTQRMASYGEEFCRRGIYSVEVRSLYSDSYVHLFGTTGKDVQNFKGVQSHFYEGERGRRISVRRLSGQRLRVRWEGSSVDPQHKEFCIVVNSRHDYASLCGATGDRFGVLPPDLMHVPYYTILNDEGTIGGRRTFDDIIVGCLKKKNHYILNNLVQGRLYYFNVFVKDTKTNLTFPYLRTTLKYETPKNLGNNVLKDAVPLKVRLGENDAKSEIVKFNLKKPCSELSLYVMACGGGFLSFRLYHWIGAERRLAYSSQEFDSLEVVRMALPSKGKYLLNLTQSANSSARMAEIFLSKNVKRFPLPRLPSDVSIVELKEARRCDSVTIEWFPSPDPRDNEYCVFLKEETRKGKFNFKSPNQCDVERSLKVDPYVSNSFCFQRNFKKDAKIVKLIQKINGLGSGKTYVVQLIVRRHNGKSISYDLLLVSTLPNCPD